MNAEIVQDILQTVLVILFIVAIFRCGFNKAALALLFTIVACLVAVPMTRGISFALVKRPLLLLAGFGPVIFVLVKYKKPTKSVAAQQ
jgi:hypothetical protein